MLERLIPAADTAIISQLDSELAAWKVYFGVAR
jgi:hypothetical protein